jgi:tetratricopeptide (TPR) repeat protein
MAGDDLENDSGELYRAARELMDAGQLEEAIGLFEESAKASPHFKTLELLGECCLRTNQTKESIIPLAAAVGLNRGVRAASLLAEAFLALGDSNKANEVADLALSRDSTNRKALEVKNTRAVYLAGKEI